MIPVTLTIHGGADPATVSLRSAEQCAAESGGDDGHGVQRAARSERVRRRNDLPLNGDIRVDGYPDVAAEHVLAGRRRPARRHAGRTDPGRRLQPDLRQSLQHARRSRRAVGFRYGARTPLGAPGERAHRRDAKLVPAETSRLRHCCGPIAVRPVIRQIPIHIPTSVSKGPLRILVSDGETLDRLRRSAPLFARKLDLASTIALLNKEHVNNRVYVSLLEADPEAVVADKVMPALAALRHERDGRNARHPGDGGAGRIFGERVATAPLDYVVSGAQVLTHHDQVAKSMNPREWRRLKLLSYRKSPRAQRTLSVFLRVERL